jgi:hypothetical protein
MSLPSFEPSGDLPEGLHQAPLTEFLARFGSSTPQRERIAWRLRQAFDLVRPLGIISRVIIWGSFVTAKPDPADADILWVTLPHFERRHLPVQVEVLFEPVLVKRLYGIDILSIPEHSAFLPTLLDGLSITRTFTRRGLVEVRL